MEEVEEDDMPTLKEIEDKKQKEYSSKFSDKLNQAVADTGVAYKDANTNYDAMYKNYKDAYMTEAKQAKLGIVDYGNRLGTNGRNTGYAQSVTDQQTQQYLTDLNRLNPVFEKLAYEQYQDQINDSFNRAKMYQAMDNDAYGRYRDAIGDDQAMRDYLYKNWQNEKESELRAYADKLALDTANKNFDFNQYKFNQNLNLDYAQLAQDKDLANQKLAEQARQDQAGLAFNYDALAQDAELAREKMATQADIDAGNLAYQYAKAEQDARLADLDYWLMGYQDEIQKRASEQAALAKASSGGGSGGRSGSGRSGGGRSGGGGYTTTDTNSGWVAPYIKGVGGMLAEALEGTTANAMIDQGINADAYEEIKNMTPPNIVEKSATKALDILGQTLADATNKVKQNKANKK